MTCGGCAGAVTRILKKIEGVEEIQTLVEEKIVNVACQDEVNSETLLAALSKWSESSGKSVEFVSEEPFAG